MCNLSETCREMKIEKKKNFSYKKNFEKKVVIKKFWLVEGFRRPVHQVFGRWRWVLWMTLHFWIIIMAPLQLPYLVRMCVIVTEMQFVRQKLESLRTWSNFISIAKSIPQNRKFRRAWFSGHGPKWEIIFFAHQCSS